MLKYVKFSSERKFNYQIETSIWEKDEDIFVKKIALNDKAQKHIQTIYDNYKILLSLYGKEHVAKCSLLSKDTVKIEYIKGVSLSDKMVIALENNNIDEFYRLVQFYQVNILSGRSSDDGEFFLLNPNEENRNTNIDLTFDNIIMKDDSYFIIDYEWLYHDVPKHFLLYRAIKGFIERRDKFKNIFSRIDIFKKYGIVNVLLYEEKEKQFYDNVLQFPNKKYEKNVIDFFRDLNEKKEREVKLRNAIEEENNRLKNSRGYRFLLRYYCLRDLIFPVNSNRRHWIKFMLKFFNINSI